MSPGEPTHAERVRAAVRHLRRADPVLGAVITRVGPCRWEPEERVRPFSALAESIIYQQITGKAAATIHRRLCAVLGCRQPVPRRILAASDDELRGAGLSRQKIASLRDLSQRVSDGLALRRLGRLPDDEVVEALSAVRGIGRWTAEMYMMFRLGRLDVLPVTDYGIRKAMQRAYHMRELPQPARMVRVAEPWRPYRTVACWYLWRSLDTQGARVE